MKVWVVEMVISYEGSTVEGVFSKKETAEAYAVRRRGEETSVSFEVTELELDVPRSAWSV